MRYSRVRVKCSDQLIEELKRFKDYCMLEKNAVFIKDFFDEVIAGIKETMERARLLNDIEEDGTVYREFSLTVPMVVWDYVKEFSANHEEGYQDIELFFDEIGRIKETAFRR